MEFKAALNAFQLYRIRHFSADSVSALLVRLRTQPAVAESVCGGGQLCVLWLVGLAVLAAHCVYLVLLLGQRSIDGHGRQEGRTIYESAQMDSGR